MKIKMLHKLLLILLIFALPSSIFSKNINIDSLEEIIISQVDDTIKLAAMSKIGWHYYERNFDKSLEKGNQILALATKLNRDVDIANAYNMLGCTNDNKSEDINIVIGYLEKAVHHLEKANDQKRKANVLNNMGLAYRRIGDYKRAFSYNLEALEIGETINDTITMVLCLNNMAIIYNQTDEDQKAKNYYFKSLDYANAINFRRMISTIKNNLANIYFEEYKLDTALTLFQESLKLKREMGNEFRIITTLSNIGKVHIREKKYELANQYLQEAYELALKLDYPYGKGLCLSYLSRSELYQLNHTKAIQYAQRGIDELGENGELSVQIGLLDVLSQSYEAVGNLSLALENYKKYQILNDSVFELERQNQNNRLEVQYQVKQKEVENKLLKTEKALIKKTLKNRTMIAVGLILFLLMAIGWALASYRLSEQRKKMNKVLEAKVTERTKALQLANDELEQANYELKTFNHIASHDIKEPIRNVGNYASLIFRRLPDELKLKFDDYFKIIKQSTNQLYTLIEDFAHYTSMSKDKEIDKESVDLNIIADSLQNGLQSTIQMHNGRVLNLGLPIIHTSGSLIYVILKNLIENGLKFNQSAVPTVELSYLETAEYHEIIIQDNGIGIEKTYFDRIFNMFTRLHDRGLYQGSGIGLAIVKLLTEKLNGRITLKSDGKSGTQFILQLPKE